MNETLATHTPTVYIVDDEKSAQRSVAALVEAMGQRAETFDSAADFLASPRLAETGCLITDVHMPEMSGLELYRHLIGAGRPIPTILMTAYPNESDRSRALSDLVLVPFPVLGIPSIQSGRVEFALTKLASPVKFYLFHQKAFSGRGVVDGERALSIAKDLGFEREKLIEAANADEITEAMKAHVRFGDTLQMQATPSFVVQDVAIIGYPGRPGMEKIIQAVRKCGKAQC